MTMFKKLSFRIKLFFILLKNKIDWWLLERECKIKAMDDFEKYNHRVSSDSKEGQEQIMSLLNMVNSLPDSNKQLKELK